MVCHLAPMAGRIADGQKDRHIPAFRLSEGIIAKGPPMHRIVGVLTQIR